MAEGEAASTSESILGKESESTFEKLAQPEPLTQPPKCPQCTSDRVYRDGLRYHRDGSSLQRWLCRSCGYRFSQSKIKININSEQFENFHSSSDLAEPSIGVGDFSSKECFDDFAFSVAEDFGVHTVTNLGKDLNNLCSKSSNRQICELAEDSKNLDATELKTVAGISQENRGKQRVRMVS